MNFNAKGDGMVTKKKIKRQERRMSNRSPVQFTGRSVLMMLLFITGVLQAQDFINTGSIRNTGTFRVKYGASGLPDTIGGRFEFFGANQTVPATNYFNLFINGNGSIKSTQGGNFEILQTINVAQDVSLQVQSGTTMTLDQLSGRLIESGSVLGRMQKTVDLVPGVDSSDFGGIGLSIAWTGNSPGSTTITRTSGSPIPVNGKSSISRFFDINATTDSLLNARLSFTYRSNELQGQNKASLDLWRSPDNGTSWRRQRVDRKDSTITLDSIPSFGSNGRWTASDSNNLLGIAKYEWEPDSLKIVDGNNQRKKKTEKLDTPFIARVVDAFNQPLSNQQVLFAIDSFPTGAINQSLSFSSATTDSLGQVRTEFTLGDKVGKYRIISYVPGVPSATNTFWADARSLIAKLLAALEKNRDSVTAVIQIQVNAKADDSSNVDQAPLTFKVLEAPDTFYKFTKDKDTTDIQGQSINNFAFGRKSGDVKVRVISAEDTTLFIDTNLFADHARPASMTGLPGAVQDTVARTKQFTMNVKDTWGNAAKGDTIQFAWSDTTGSMLDSYTALGFIDSLGYATATVKLGEKVGRYALTATVLSQPYLKDTVYLDATNDRPAVIIPETPSIVDTIEQIHSLSAIVNDRYTNAVPSISVNFTA